MTFGSKAGRRRMWRGWDVNCPCCYVSRGYAKQQCKRAVRREGKRLAKEDT